MSKFRLSTKFEVRAPAPQNAIDIFTGSWASDFAAACPNVKAGDAPFFTEDSRPVDAARVLGIDGRLDGMRVLELGPLEGAHTYQLEKLGAKSVVSIEANAEAYLKCLVTKEITGLSRAQFRYGDFTKYVESTDDRYDMVFASGVLYHMKDPIALIMAMGRITKSCFVWTHYFSRGRFKRPKHRLEYDPRFPGVKLYVFRPAKEAMVNKTYRGGNLPIAVWLTREDILATFRKAGFGNIEIVEDSPDTELGASFTFAAWK